MSIPTGWRSGWVTRTTGIAMRAAAPTTGSQAAGTAITELVGLALRDNPRRAFLLVSRVLGKHVPVAPSEAGAAAAGLADAVSVRLGEAPAPPAFVLGFAETATGLGHAVAVALGAPYLHSTRRPGEVSPEVGFDEAHSHARAHALCPSDASLLRGGGPVVLVDDEMSTGSTALNTIAALEQIRPRERYVVAALVDVRRTADERRLTEGAAALGVEILWVTLARGTLLLPPGASDRAAGARVVAAHLPSPGTTSDECGKVTRVPVGWPAAVREGGRYGITAAGSQQLDAAAAGVASDLVAVMTTGPGRVLVLGTEELLYAPMRIAAHLEAAGVAVWFSSTTRSPAVVVADEEYALRDRISFRAHDLAGGETADRFAYNIERSPTGQPWTDIVVVVDTVSDTPELATHGGLLDQVSALAPAVWLVTLPVTA